MNRLPKGGGFDPNTLLTDRDIQTACWNNIPVALVRAWLSTPSTSEGDRQTTIHDNGVAGDVSAARRAQECYRLGRLGRTCEWNAAPPDVELLELHGLMLIDAIDYRHRRVDKPGRRR